MMNKFIKTALVASMSGLLVVTAPAVAFASEETEFETEEMGSMDMGELIDMLSEMDEETLMATCFELNEMLAEDPELRLAFIEGAFDYLQSSFEEMDIDLFDEVSEEDVNSFLGNITDALSSEEIQNYLAAELVSDFAEEETEFETEVSFEESIETIDAILVELGNSLLENSDDELSTEIGTLLANTTAEDLMAMLGAFAE